MDNENKKLSIKQIKKQIKKEIPRIKRELKESSKRFMWQLGYKPLKEPKDEDIKTLLKKTIRNRQSRKIEAEIENIMMSSNLYNNQGEYAMHLNTSKKSNNHYATYWKVPRGLKIQDYMEKEQVFADGLVGQVLIEQRNGCLCIEVWEGIIPMTKKGIKYDFKYIDYMNDYILPLPVGVNQMEGLYIWDLIKVIHCIISGSIGSGKSILLTSWVDALLQNPNVLLFVIDLAMTDFAHTRDYCVFGYDINTAELIIDYIKQEAEKRRRILVEFGDVNVIRFNKKFPEYKMPYYVLVIDEFAFTSPARYLNKEERQRRQGLQAKVSEIAQISRKLGIHLIISTQKPSKQLFPEEITTHFPGRISFKTNDRGTSMTILGNTKAYYLPNQPGRLIAQHGNRQVEAQALYLDPDVAKERMKMFDKFDQYEKYCKYKMGDDLSEWQYKILQYEKKRLLPRSRNKTKS